jgi:ribosomal protein L6P/L9E
MQLRLTTYGNGWQAVLPVYGNGFRSATSENQRLHKKLGNSENRVTYRLR